MGETERGFFKQAVEKFGDEEGDGEAAQGAEPGAPEGLGGEAMDHVDETETDAPVDEVDGIGAGAEILDNGIGKPFAHASEDSGKEDGGKGDETDEKSFAAAVEPHQDADEQGKGHPAADMGTKVGTGGEGAEGEEIPGADEKSLGFEKAPGGDGEGGQGDGGEGGGGKKDGSGDADGAAGREEKEGAEGVEEVELELQAEGPSGADDVSEAKEILEIEKVGGQLNGGGLGKIVGGENHFSQGGRGNPEENHGDVRGKKADVAADGETQGKARGETVTGQ